MLGRMEEEEDAAATMERRYLRRRRRRAALYACLEEVSDGREQEGCSGGISRCLWEVGIMGSTQVAERSNIGTN